MQHRRKLAKLLKSEAVQGHPHSLDNNQSINHLLWMQGIGPYRCEAGQALTSATGRRPILTPGAGLVGTTLTVIAILPVAHVIHTRPNDTCEFNPPVLTHPICRQNTNIASETYMYSYTHEQQQQQVCTLFAEANMQQTT